MKKILLLILFATFFKSHGQVYTAGTQFSVYSDINPDVMIKYQITPYTNETYSLNLFGDSQNDIVFMAQGSISSGGSSAYIKVISQNPDVYIAFGRWDSVFVPGGPSWNVTKVARPFVFGEAINNSGIVWDNTTLFLTDHSGAQGGNKNVNDWVGGDKYMALKYQSGSLTTYGWIKVSCISEDTCYIKEYSHTPLTTGVAENNKEDVKVYPNPVTNVIYIDQNSSEVYGMKLSDALGREVKFTYEVKDKKIKLSLSNDLPEGCYFLQYKAGEASFVKKVVKER